MTQGELDVMEALIDAWNLFVELPVEHGDDAGEFRHHLHILQRQILARQGRRDFNESAN